MDFPVWETIRFRSGQVFTIFHQAIMWDKSPKMFAGSLPAKNREIIP